MKSPPRGVRNPHFEKRRRKLGKGKGGLFGREISRDVDGVDAQGFPIVEGQGLTSPSKSKNDAPGVNAQGVSTIDGQGFSSVGLLGSKGSRNFAVNGGTYSPIVFF